MNTSVYEQAFFGSFANDDARPPRPSVIDLAIAVIGRDHYHHDWRGHWVWHMGRWNGPFKLPEFIREANRRLKARGKPQIDANPNWKV